MRVLKIIETSYTRVACFTIIKLIPGITWLFASHNHVIACNTELVRVLTLIGNSVSHVKFVVLHTEARPSHTPPTFINLMPPPSLC
jgi:hypothetical protein